MTQVTIITVIAFVIIATSVKATVNETDQAQAKSQNIK